MGMLNGVYGQVMMMVRASFLLDRFSKGLQSDVSG